MNYIQGSEWRKWDLHVHTPDSIENHFSGNSIEDKWEKYILDLEHLPSDVKVLGINDYLFIDGYKRLLNAKKQGRLTNIDSLFPVIEFRIKKFAGHKDFKRINFHVIFSPDLNPDLIQSQFLNVLQGKYQLSPGLEGVKWNASITKDSIEDLGKKIKETIPKGELKNYGSDLIEGFNNLNLDEEEIIGLLKENTYLQNDYLLAIGKTEWDSLSWNDQSIAEKKDIINKVHFVFIASEKISAFQSAKDKLIEKAVNRNLLDCSDAHYNSSSIEKDRIGNCCTWIKADTTFKGLRQAFYEFDDRVFIGDLPPSKARVSSSPTRYIKSIDIQKVTDSRMPESWFENLGEIPINSGLVAIIGNKGNGKSALTDILGLLCNSHKYDYFSFLHPHKFLKKKPYNRAESFIASISWYSGYKSEYISLGDGVDYSISEKVKYLPQNYLEKICSDDIESENFETELKNVVFSHLDESQKLDATTFDEYIEYRTTEINKKITKLQSKLNDANLEFADLESQIHPSYLKNLEDKLKSKKEELKVHQANRIKKVKKPDADKEYKAKQHVITAKLEGLQIQAQELGDTIKVVKQTKKETNQKILDFEKLKKGLEAIAQEATDFYDNFEIIFSTYNIERTSVFDYQLNFIPINSILETSKIELAQIDDRLNFKKETSLPFQLNIIQEEIKNTQKELSEPFRLYQKYLEDTENWSLREKEITGNKEIEDTLEYFKEKIRIVKTDIPDLLSAKKISILKIVEEIFNSKLEIIDLYKNAYNPVMSLIVDNKSIMDDYSMEFAASLTMNAFPTSFFSFINQGSKGTFCGKNEGYTQLLNTIENASFNSFSDLIKFIDELIDKLKFDSRDNKTREERHLSEQLRKDINSSQFYNFLYGLDYLNTIYQLRLAGKDLTELSPGERGALLLIFYLLLDKSNDPLIIDQPEENLDNESVYNILVKFIKIAKDRRQVIIVTHNPNLAVVCDSEQIIKVNIEKENKNRFSYISGSIENEVINNEIVKILEGTKPAFKNRKLKYENVSPDFIN
jgi:hypothetical protein